LTGEPTELIFGQIWVEGVTPGAGPGAGITAELGYGPNGTLPTELSWSWITAVYNLDMGNNDEFMAQISAPAAGAYDYAYRYSRNGGPYCYGDVDGSTNGYSPEQAGALTVTDPTPTPTLTPQPTVTPQPSETPEPTVTPVPTPVCERSGDVNGDGQVTPGDAQQTFLIYLDCVGMSPSWTAYCAADFCGAGPIAAVCSDLVTPADALGIFKYYLGYPSPCE